MLQIILSTRRIVLCSPSGNLVFADEQPWLIYVGMYLNEIKRRISREQVRMWQIRTTPFIRVVDISSCRPRPPTCPSVGQLVNSSLDILEKTEKDHVVDPGPNQNDGDAFVHAGFGDSHGGLADLLRLSEQHALRSGLAGVEGVSL